MVSLILVLVLPGGSCPPGLSDLALPRMLAYFLDANRVRFRLM